MKCGKCGKNEATYYYKESINGVSRELRLCEDCAREEGLENRFRSGFPFDRSFGFGGSFFEDFFSPFESIFALPERRAVAANRQQTAQQTQQAQQTQKEEQNPAAESGAECNEELKRLRQQNMLERQLREAVAKEDYETAIKLRDQLKELRGN